MNKFTPSFPISLRFTLISSHLHMGLQNYFFPSSFVGLHISCFPMMHVFFLPVYIIPPDLKRTNYESPHFAVFSSFFLLLSLSCNRYSYGQSTWCVDERLVTVAAEVLATSCWKHLSQVSVLNSSSSCAVQSIVWVTWTFCLCFEI
jgi:hypothetical protein